jgi:hypothetical protein
MSDRGLSIKEKSIKPKSMIIKLRSTVNIQPWEEWYVLRSEGRRATVISYLFHKWLFAELTREERLVFYTFPEVLTDSYYYIALRASNSGYSKKTIRKAVETYKYLFSERKGITFERWMGYRTFLLSISIEKRYAPTRKGKKYSGYVKHYKDHGSIAPPKEDPFYLTPKDEDDKLSIFLQVCETIVSGKSEFFFNNIRVKL